MLRRSTMPAVAARAGTDWGSMTPIDLDGIGVAKLGGADGPPALRQPDGSGSLFGGLMADLRGAFDDLQSLNPFLPQAGRGDAGAREPGGRFHEVAFATAAGGRSYRLYVPTTSAAGIPMPLVVMLHGCSQSPEDFAAGTRMNAFAERNGFLACYPEQIASANGQRCWNWFNRDDQSRDRGEPSLIADMTRAVMARHAVDPARVYVAGLSAGGALAATMGQLYPDLYAAVGVHSGLASGAAHDLGSALAAMRRGGGTQVPEGSATTVPAIVFHGDRDATVAPINGDEVRIQAIHAAAVSAEAREGRVPGGRAYACTRFRDGGGRVMAEQWSVHGAGHAWSGGSAAGSFTDPAGPDASREMLRFFAEHVGTAR